MRGKPKRRNSPCSMFHGAPPFERLPERNGRSALPRRGKGPVFAVPGPWSRCRRSRAVYRFHPMFCEATFPVYYGGDDVSHQPATLEGGDIHVLGRGVVLIGMGERTTPMGVEILA